MKRISIKTLCLLSVVLFGAITIARADTLFDGSSSVTLVGDEVLQLASGTVSLGGDRIIALTGTAKTATLKIGASAGSGAVTVKPADNTDAQLLFDVVDIGSTLTIEVLNDLFFTSNNTGNKPMFLSFRGKGKVIFRLPSGRTLSFGTQNSSSIVGTKVRVLMDHTKSQAAAQSLVSFEKWSYSADDTNDTLSAHTYIKFGQFSSFEFVSQHASGLPVGGGVIDYGYGAVSFDPSNEGTGRMIIDLARGAVDGDFKDAAFNIYGSRIIGSGVSDTDVAAVDFRTHVYEKYRAGIEATIRISDAVAALHFVEDDAGWVTHQANTDNQRGLVIINHNRSYPRLANNYDLTVEVAAPSEYDEIVGLNQSKWFVANTVQTGFVLGNNGVIEIAHNRFLDYCAASTNVGSDLFPVAGTHVATGATSSGGTHHASKVKKHNPAALIIDGNAFRLGDTTAAIDPLYAYNSHDIAQVKLIGNAGIFARVIASSSTGDIYRSMINVDGSSVSSGTYIDGTIGKGTYNGKVINVMNGDNLSAHQSTAADGEIAIDIEGPVRFSSIPTTDDAHPAGGYINIPSVLIDHRGKELKFVSGALAYAGVRPLSMATGIEYFRYNTSSVMVNDQVELEYIKWVHNDVTRDLSALPHATGRAAIFGGELPSLRVAHTLMLNPAAQFLDFTGSRIFLDNSRVECHESLVSAGVRWGVRDGLIDVSAGDALIAGDNSSSIVLYNRGDAYDQHLTGLGRVFQLGSRANVMADGSTQDPIAYADGAYPRSSLRDAYIDVFRQEPLPASLLVEGDETNTIKLSVTSEQESGVSAHARATHILHIGERSQVNLGWSAGQYKRGSNILLEVDSRYRPWEYTHAVLDFVRGLDPENELEYRFSPFEQGIGQLVLAADNLYVSAGGRYNAAGILTPTLNELPPRNVSDSGGIIFVDHGGSLTVGENKNDVLLDTVVARRTSAIAGGRGVISLPNDQVLLQENGKIITYGYDAVIDEQPVITPGHLPVATFSVTDIPLPDGFTSVKGVGNFLTRSIPTGLTRTFRSTDSVTAPVPMPSSGLVVLGAGDYIEQAKISAATRAQPLHLWITGDSSGFGRVREFVSVKSDPAVLGEGAHAALFLDGGARIGLGSRRYSEASSAAWNHLGQDKVSLFVNGNGVVDLNDDLLVIDKLPIIATENFGQGSSAHILEFTSDVPREIRIMENGELDLSSFGRSGAAKQQIKFSGKVTLVVEPGAKIRFPSTVTSSDPANGPVLYFSDEAKIVFLGNTDTDRGRWTDGLTGSDKVRTKLLGIGQIWLNKQARMEIFDNALVGVESDVVTPLTDLTISIRRQAGLYIGDDSSAGGGFQIGNMLTGGGDGTNIGTGSTPTLINFKLLLNGDQAYCNIGRNGFFGVGAGTINKDNNINGTLPSETIDPEADPAGVQYSAWRLQSLFDVKNFTIDITRGYFDHSRIYDGTSSSSDGSLFAIGTLGYNSDTPSAAINGGRYTVKLGKPDEAYILGGGNIVVVDAGVPHGSPKAMSIWSAAQNLVGTADTGKYTIMAPSAMIRTYETNPSGDEATFTLVKDANNAVTSYTFQSRTVSDVNSQGGAYIELYNTLSMPTYNGTHPAKFVTAGKTSNGVVAGYLVATTAIVDGVTVVNRNIVRQLVAGAKDIFGNPVSPTLALEQGYFKGTGISNGAPDALTVPKQ